MERKIEICMDNLVTAERQSLFTIILDIDRIEKILKKNYIEITSISDEPFILLRLFADKSMYENSFKKIN